MMPWYQLKEYRIVIIEHLRVTVAQNVNKLGRRPSLYQAGITKNCEYLSNDDVAVTLNVKQHYAARSRRYHLTAERCITVGITLLRDLNARMRDDWGDCGLPRRSSAELAQLVLRSADQPDAGLNDSRLPTTNQRRQLRLKPTSH